MQRAVWIIAAIGFVLWSLFAWAGYAMLNWVGDFAASNAGQFTPSAELADWIRWAAELIGVAGGTVIGVIWLFGSAIIAALAFGISRLLLRREPPRSARFQSLPPGTR